jgi:hypothetical protein
MEACIVTDLRKAAEMALEALQESKPIDPYDEHAFNRSALAIEALRQALAKDKQKSVAYRTNGFLCHEVKIKEQA